MQPHVQLLGAPFVRVGERRHQPAPNRGSALAYYLAYRGGGWVARDELCGLLWPERPNDQARGSLRQALFVLRREPWALQVEAERQRVRWPVATDLASDAPLPAAPATLLEGFRLQEAPAFDRWLELARDEVVAEQRRAAQRAARRALDAGHAQEAVERLEPWWRHDPLDEATLRLLLEAKTAQGLHADAKALHDAFAARLDHEFGFAPAAATSAWIAAPTPPPTTARSPRAAPTGTDLPVAAENAFVGRAAELGRLASALVSGPGVFVVVGPGGVGKTRLTTEAVRRVSGGIGGPVRFVPLVEASARVGAATAVAGAVAPNANPDVPPAERIAAALGDGPALVVLDNVEQIGDVEALLRTLRARCPGARWLVSSRRRLRGSWTTTLELEGLPSDAGGEASERVAPAVRLFEAVAARHGVTVHPERDRPAIAALCRSVGGAPLAIELAASWTRALPLAVALERWHDELFALPTPGEERPPRHATLHRTVQATCDLLGAADRAALARLGVFAGGCDIDAADAVADVGLARLAALRDASLITVSREGRVTQHPVVAHSLRRLQGDLGPLSDALRDRHARHYLRELQRREDEGQNRDPLAALRAIQREHPNLERAWHRAVEREMWPLLTAGGAFLALSYVLAGDERSWPALIGSALAEIPEEHPSWAFLEGHLGAIDAFYGLEQRAYRRCRLAETRLSEAADPKVAGWLAFQHGDAARRAGRTGEARAALERAVRRWRRSAEAGLESMAVERLTRLARTREEHDRWYAHGAAVRRRGDPTLPVMRTKAAVAAVERALTLVRDDGAYGEATERIDFALEVQRTVPWNTFDLVLALAAASEVRRAAGDVEGAVRDAEEAASLLGTIAVSSYVDAEAVRLTRARAHAGAADFARAAALLDRFDAPPSREVLRARAELALGRGDLDAAAHHLGALRDRGPLDAEIRRDRWRRAETALLFADHADRVAEPEAARQALRRALELARDERFDPTTLQALTLTLRRLPRECAERIGARVARHPAARRSTRIHPALEPWRGGSPISESTAEPPPTDLDPLVQEVLAALA